MIFYFQMVMRVLISTIGVLYGVAKVGLPFIAQAQTEMFRLLMESLWKRLAKNLATYVAVI